MIHQLHLVTRMNYLMIEITLPANTRRWLNVDLMLGQRRRRWPNIESTFGQRLESLSLQLKPMIIKRGGRCIEDAQRDDSSSSSTDCSGFALLSSIVVNWLLKNGKPVRKQPNLLHLLQVRTMVGIWSLPVNDELKNLRRQTCAPLANIRQKYSTRRQVVVWLTKRSQVCRPTVVDQSL